MSDDHCSHGVKFDLLEQRGRTETVSEEESKKKKDRQMNVNIFYCAWETSLI